MWSEKNQGGGVTRASSRRVYYLRFTLLFYAVWMALHIAVGNLSAGIPAHDLSMPLDAQIPLLPSFVWIYLFAYLFPFFLLAVVRDWHSLNITFLSLIILNVAAYPVFLNFPVTFVQPFLGDTLSERVLASVYATHLPPGANNLPSLHVALALTFYLCYRKELTNALVSGLTGVIAILITLSTLFVKEHIVIDAVAGILWALAAWALAHRLYPRLVDMDLDPETALRRMLRKLWPLVFGSFLLTAICTALHSVLRS